MRRILIGTTCSLLIVAQIASAQDMEPRAYSSSPVGTNFIVLGYVHSEGDVLLDPSLPLTDVRTKIHVVSPGYSRVFGLAGHAFSFAGIVPYVHGNVKGKISDTPGEVTRDGIGDVRMRIATNLLGGKALSLHEFAAHSPSTTVGTSLSILAPTGEYNSERLINIGSNRWGFKPELGGSHQIDNWFMDGSAGVWFFTDNPKFYGDVRRSQDPIAVYQVHAGYTFRPGLWLAGDFVYYEGGKTTVGGKHNQDLQANTRYGATLSIPLSSGFALKLAASKGLSTTIGGDFTTLAAAIQYRWFDDEP